jgi:NadR type nicotinamide-nucleotide adenylyltransferase
MGLTLGKFAPLHKGHQYVIEIALAEMDELIIMIYDCPDITPIPLNVRSQWLRDIYPQAEVIEAWDGPMQVSDKPEIKLLHEQYILKRLQGRKITHFYSSEFYGDHVSQALGAANRSIDSARQKYPVSGTQLRQDAFAYRQYIDPRVYRDLITNVCLLGAPATGKTTLAEWMAKKYSTVWMPEYGREYWEKYQINRRLTLQQLVEIASGHLERENKMLLEANRYLFTDTNAVTTYMFSLYYHGKADPRLVQMAQACAQRYDLVFVCDADIPYDDTWDRSGEVNRQIFQKQIVADLQQRRIPFFKVCGTLPQRADRIEKILNQYQKYMNLTDIVKYAKD